MFVGKKIKSLVINKILENVEFFLILFDIDEVCRPGPIFTIKLRDRPCINQDLGFSDTLKEPSQGTW